MISTRNCLLILIITVRNALSNNKFKLISKLLINTFTDSKTKDICFNL